MSFFSNDILILLGDFNLEPTEPTNVKDFFLIYNCKNIMNQLNEPM